MRAGNHIFAIVLTTLLAVGVAAQADAALASDKQRYVIEFTDEPLASYEGTPLAAPQAASRSESSRKQLEATSPRVTGARKLDVHARASRDYLRYLEQEHDAFLLDARGMLGRAVRATHVYRHALNGMALDLSPAEAEKLAKSPWVKSIRRDTRQRVETYAGPEWIGAGEIWNGSSGFPVTRGEGVVIGVIDSGINWEHPSFADPGQDGYHYNNPMGSQLGLCSNPEVMCNDKLVGVYDFVEDDPGTPDMVEENTNGRDNHDLGHGSHVAGIAAGNVLNVTLNGVVNTRISGVAPHANLIAYRVCYVGDPPDPDGGGCPSSAILAAIDQALADGVDVINHSLGSDAFPPWLPGEIPMAFLNARNAGIFVVTSAGNAGPNPGTVGSPANAPWVFAVGNATHDQILGSVVENLSGGGTVPPSNLVGLSLSVGIGVRKIVHAKDYGSALCGTGAAELESSCAANLGLSNPWSGQTPFNGEIVVCDRGTYGRIEKGKNVMLAGAGGFILANTDEDGESLRADDHCLPASHIGDQDGDNLRSWLSSGTNHKGSISGFMLVKDQRFADRVHVSSSRGPLAPPVQEILKPDVIAPGTFILAASNVGQELRELPGTSMSSPHVAGAAALLLAVNPSWNVAQVASSLATTASAALARDVDGSPASPHERGSGRPQLGEAANAGLYLNVTGSQFASANPAAGGNPRTLNLPGLVHTDCQGSCSFTRTVTDQMGGGSWTAAPANFPAGVAVSISPATFTLSNGSSRALTININLADSDIVGEWVYGDILLTAPGSADQALTAAVFSSGGDLPPEWLISDDRDVGWKEFSLDGLAAMPDVTLSSGGLVPATRTVKTLIQDPTTADPRVEKGLLSILENEDPFDGGQGVFTVWHNLPQGGLWLHAETLASSAGDIDLYVGRDDNLDGFPDKDEQLCDSRSPVDLELCDIFNPPPGNYWIVVQNWAGTKPGGDDVTLISAAVDGSDQSALVATGPGMVSAGEQFKVRLSWSDIDALPGEEWLGAVGLGTRRGQPNNIGVIPVRFNRTAIAGPMTLPLVNGKTHHLALKGNAVHDRMFIDIPPGVNSLQVAALGGSSSQNNALSIELLRQDFAAALSSPPFAQLPGGLVVTGNASGAGGNGPEISLSSGLTPGRYFVKLANTSANAAAVRISANATSVASSLSPHRGLWDFDRGISQGAEWNGQGSFRFSVWYAYDDDGEPTWFIASAAAVTGNIWTADLLRVTNDGAQQQEKKVGTLSITFIADNRMIYGYTVLGQSGFDPMHPNGPNTCPSVGGGPKSFTGHWYRGVDGLGGSTVLVYQSAQAQVHYLYDAKGEPRWTIAADDANQSATASVIPLLQFRGFCAVCTPVDVTFGTIGSVTRSFSNESSGSWTLDFELDAPLNQSVNRTDNIVKLSDTLECE